MSTAPPWAPRGTTLIERLGVGSVFEVARVRDENNRELIAKRLAPPMRRADLEAALDRECVLLTSAAGRCLALPELVASGIDEHGGFILETAAPGVSVRALAENGPLPGASWSELAAIAARALADLHGATDASGALGIVHGDISPDNLFAGGGRATFIDLSSATFRDAPLPALSHGRGTLPYAAPEVARNDGQPSQATDTYALAATLLFLAVGPLTDAPTEASRLLEIGSRGLSCDKLERRTDLPLRARSALASALRFEPSQRLADARDLARALSV
jgi:serine/threonine-protein kinase